ncbi:MAG: TadE/TadG family type IV pilus assembly protein [Alphaproteobacteria bacterium]
MAAEFALIAPLLLLVTVGIFETIFVISDLQTASEATRRGARLALIGAPVAGLGNVSNTVNVVCTGNGGGGDPTCTNGTVQAAQVFSGMVAAMQQIVPWLEPQNVRVTYAKSDIADESGLLTPLITVEIINATYQPKVTSSFNLDLAIPLPSFETSQLGPTIVLN